MITKDEEELLPRCLESVKGHVEEMIIVDTGSTDNTCKIALKFGAKIYHRPWENDFAKARNFGIDKAKGDWILFLDADETLEQGELLRELIKQEDEDIYGYLFQILNYSDENKTHVERSSSVRLFRNIPEMRFSGAIHEQLPIKDKYMAMTDLVIHHYGYIPAISLAKEKSKRNLTILEEEIKKSPEDGFVYYNLASEYARLYQHEKAVYYYKESLKRTKGETGYESRLYKMIGLSSLGAKQWNESIPILSKGIEKFPDYPDLYYVRGILYEAAGDYIKALANFTKCLAMHGKSANDNKIFVVEDGVTSYKAHYYSGRIFEKMNKPQDALTAYSKALQINPYFKEPLLNIKYYFQGEPEKILSFLEDKVYRDIKSVETKIITAKHFFETGDFKISLSILNNLNNQKVDERVNYLLGLVNFKLDQFEKAVYHLAKIKKDDEGYHKALPYLAGSLWITGNVNKAKQILSGSENPGDNYMKTAVIFLSYGEEKLLEGLKKYPNSNTLKNEYQRIKKVKENVQSNPTS